MITKAFLIAAGYHTQTANGGRAALKAMGQHSYDLVLLDMNMPDMDGLETFGHIRQQFGALPVIALTADALPEDKRRYLSEGLDGYIAKPLERTVMLDEVRKRLNDACVT